MLRDHDAVTHPPDLDGRKVNKLGLLSVLRSSWCALTIM
ncbi:hypothetical protein SD3246_1492 [Salmonella enterica subsp. enterica serovar Dublin str. SD3246]|uniref:Uncharacterized protein n=1 Tax=Salmonella enterica subsp. enterica serovar Dublin str. SD3246 TaxID=909945 RepID=A0A8X6ESB6_SALDU|nr:hypothetical protein SD3246_1492 [Salmonella enterica subsp. enterica serovar Dublin str. SD3246]